MPDFLINDIYPQVYWNLPNVDEAVDSYELWWSSAERQAFENGTQTSEFLEIDFGRKRVLNYICFDITRKPVDITIEYDEWSHSDPAMGKSWREVTPLREFPGRTITKFDNKIIYDQSANINPWLHAEFFLANERGEAVTTQRLRIRFTRRQAEFPFANGTQAIWSIDVQNLRTARYVTDLQDARGILVDSPDFDTQIDLFNQSNGASLEIWQGFKMPNGYIRGEQGGLIPPKRDSVITEIVPNMIGLGFMVQGVDDSTVSVPVPKDPDGTTARVKYSWSLHDVTDGEDTTLASGQAVEHVLGFHGWVDVFFDEPIPTDSQALYQLRISSDDLTLSRTVYLKNGNPLKTASDESTTDIDAYVVRDQTNIQRQNDAAIAFRIWADIGEAGKDIFGNEYREGVRRDVATNVTDDTLHTNWVSGPNPDPRAVECLYFDIRNLDENTGKFSPSVIDSIHVDPITPGIFMTVYYSNENLQGTTPSTVDYPDGWEGVRWTPVLPPGAPYKLDREQVFHLPSPINAAWVCLEFTSLQPIPYRLSEFTDLPPVAYKLFPDSVYQRMNVTKPTSDDLFVQNQSSVSVNLLSLFKVSDEFNYRLYQNSDINFITSDIYQTANQIVQGVTGGNSFAQAVDPTTLAQIYFLGTQGYYNALPTKTNTTTSLLGQFVATSYFGQNYATSETPFQPASSVNNFVSNLNDRDILSYATQREVVDPLWFPDKERHPYSVAYGAFLGQKAYFAGIAEIKFLRKDFGIERDDVIIHDILAETDLVQSPLIEFSTWQPEVPSTIPTGQTVWVTYTVNNIEYQQDIQFEPVGSNFVSFEPEPLFFGGGRAVNVSIYSGENKTGTMYVMGVDYDITFDDVLQANYIGRNTVHYRLISTNIKSFADSAVISGVGQFNITEIATYTEGTVVEKSISEIFSSEIFQHGTPREFGKSGHVKIPLFGSGKDVHS